MELTTYTTLMLIFLAGLSAPHLISHKYKVLALIGSLGFIITGIALVSDGRGLVVENGKTIITENKTGGDTETTQEIIYEEINAFLTQLIQISTLLGGIALFYTQYEMFYAKKTQSAWQRRL